MTDLFIGVVSHEGTRFPLNQGADGLAASLIRALELRGLSSELVINTADDWTPAVLELTQDLAKTSQRASLRFEQTWKAYLDEGSNIGTLHRAADSLTFLARHLKLSLRELSPGFRQSSMASVRRLINIELSHVKLWQLGIASGAPWVLVIEDDGSCADIKDLADGLAGLFDLHQGLMGNHYINLSASFQTKELGTGHLLASADRQWAGPQNRRIQQADRPITNTVCAIAYRVELLNAIVEEFGQLSMAPVIPIDFKLNAALMALRKREILRAGDCLQVEPPPIIQMSMHEMG